MFTAIAVREETFAVGVEDQIGQKITNSRSFLNEY